MPGNESARPAHGGQDAILPGPHYLVTIRGMELLNFAGSSRQHSLNRQLAATAAAMARDAGAQVAHLKLATLDIPLYNGRN